MHFFSYKCCLGWGTFFYYVTQGGGRGLCYASYKYFLFVWEVCYEGGGGLKIPKFLLRNKRTISFLLK